METTRHFTATIYVVNDGATALHEHDRLGITVPPGGHIDRDELPHEAAVRECREETGLEATLLSPGETPAVETETGRRLPQPRHQMLYDVDVHDGRVAHQHVDHIYYATVPSREIAPPADEASVDAWRWYSAADLREQDLERDVVSFGLEAIAAARDGR
ncbi:NUDIX hydrolase [Natronobiforma cellulositropha]|uniref:NUDIX hydrolase n=1 Tax=Natronobiforma cellulositropha TaxID=1679076 RepID=UPI0021D5B077|nr:NUDIX domain-containing protein [Natronobiforma cellulositropha]